MRNILSSSGVAGGRGGGDRENVHQSVDYVISKHGDYISRIEGRLSTGKCSRHLFPCWLLIYKRKNGEQV